MSPSEPSRGDALDVAALVAGTPFAAALRAGAPLLAASLDPPRVRFASDAAMALVGARSLAEAGAAMLDGQSPGARRLRELARILPYGAPRLEFLRFFAGRRPLSLTLFCARVVNAAGEAFLVLAPPIAAQGESAAATTPVSAAPSDGKASSGSPLASERFLWRVDQHLRFAGPVAALAAALGAHAPEQGESLGALKARTGLDEDGRLAAALAVKATFSALRLSWPQGDGGGPLTALLSGAPIFDANRRFLGFRGFGQFVETPNVARAAEPAPAIAAETPALAQSPAAPPPREAPPPDAEEPLLEPTQRPELEPPDSLVAPAHDGAATRPQPEQPSDAPKAPERSADVVPLRVSPAIPSSQNVVPIRPDLRHFSPPEEIRGGEGEQSVELTPYERSAFREIARALGAKVRGGEREAEESDAPETRASEPAHDVIDLDQSEATSPPAPVANENAIAIGLRDAANLVDRLPIGALVARGEDALYLNRTLLDLLGYADLEHFRAAAGVEQTFGGADASAGVLNAIDGEKIAVDSFAQIIEWGGAPATLYSFRRSAAAEITPRLRALESEARARHGEARELAAILDTATDGVVLLDHQGAILSLNRSAEALFGLDQRDARGENFTSLFAPEAQEAAKAYFEGLRTSGLASLANDGRELVGKERRGRAIPLFVTMGRLGAAADAKFCAVLRDMTHWKTIERDLEDARRQAERASALKSEFLAKISHEIRTPLNAIIGFAEVMMEERFGSIGNEKYKEYVGDIHASGGHVMSLVNDLLDLSKIEAGKLDLKLAPIDANLIIQECVALMQPQAAHERVIMRLSLAEKLPRVVADERSLRQIMLNLMSNAVKFNEPGGQVIVSTAVNDSGQAMIRVRDTGVGMSENEIATALEPFRQVASSTRKAGGTGLGLPLTKALTEANRAAFSIKSRKEQGTLVELAFPTTPAAAAQ
jgi:PAS domain S-box-containing protein